MGTLLDTTPEPREIEAPPKRVADRMPSSIELLTRSALSLTFQPVRAARVSLELLRAAPTLVRSPGRPHLPVIDDLLDRARSRTATLERPHLRAPRTPFNRPITPHRRFAFFDVPLADVKAIKKAAGVTINDVVMALCAGALRRRLLERDALPEAPLVAGIPVSVRTEAEKGAGGNRVSAMLAALPTNQEDPLLRLQAVTEATKVAKEQHGALPADLLSDVTAFAMPALAGQAARLSARLRLVERISPFNLIVSNVPGPNIPLYYAGAQMLSYYPLSAIADGQGLNITVISYRDQMNFGLIACRELVPDLDVMAGYLQDEVRVLLKSLNA